MNTEEGDEDEDEDEDEERKEYNFYYTLSMTRGLHFTHPDCFITSDFIPEKMKNAKFPYYEPNPEVFRGPNSIYYLIKRIEELRKGLEPDLYCYFDDTLINSIIPCFKSVANPFIRTR
tara:strand:- start:196 stop:549 length:354 start_codon:yes stop_codon:yes gene_type:complete